MQTIFDTECVPAAKSYLEYIVYFFNVLHFIIELYIRICINIIHNIYSLNYTSNILELIRLEIAVSTSVLERIMDKPYFIHLIEITKVPIRINSIVLDTGIVLRPFAF